jgi:hypothetical protein
MDQYEKIVTYMSQNMYSKVWWYAFDFMQPSLGELFVGYEASARLSELAKEYPEVFDSKKDGKYLMRRLKVETLDTGMGVLPPNLKRIVSRYYKPGVNTAPTLF